jgi:hypothetical protein
LIYTNGFIEQWGWIPTSSSSSGSTTVNFSIPFSENTYFVSAIGKASDGYAMTVTVKSQMTTGMILAKTKGGNTTFEPTWSAKGY